MKNSNRYAWTWKVRNEYLEEYVKMHLEPWPEVLAEHRKAGIRNYSIFQEGSRFFYCFECDNLQEAFAYINQSEVCNRWNAITSTMIEIPFDYNQQRSISFMQEVFYLE